MNLSFPWLKDNFSFALAMVTTNGLGNDMPSSTLHTRLSDSSLDYHSQF
jgi:hypothetical protein